MSHTHAHARKRINCLCFERITRVRSVSARVGRDRQEFISIAVPEQLTSQGMMFGVESTAFFDKFVRSGQMTSKQGKRRVGSRLVSAVDYLQSQRLRMMMMTELYDATKHVDCYLVASGPSRGSYRTPPKPGGMGELLEFQVVSSVNTACRLAASQNNMIVWAHSAFERFDG